MCIRWCVNASHTCQDVQWHSGQLLHTWRLYHGCSQHISSLVMLLPMLMQPAAVSCVLPPRHLLSRTIGTCCRRKLPQMNSLNGRLLLMYPPDLRTSDARLRYGSSSSPASVNKNKAQHAARTQMWRLTRTWQYEQQCLPSAYHCARQTYQTSCIPTHLLHTCHMKACAILTNADFYSTAPATPTFNCPWQQCRQVFHGDLLPSCRVRPQQLLLLHACPESIGCQVGHVPCNAHIALLDAYEMKC